MSALCKSCGEPKPPGQGRRLCDACQELARWRNKAREHGRAVRRRRPCEGCGGVKEPGHGRKFCSDCARKRPKYRGRPRICRFCQTTVIIPPRQACDLCKAQSAAKRKLRDRERHRRYRDTHERPRARKPNDPEQQRMANRLRAERNGTPAAPIDEDAYFETYGYDAGPSSYPAQPLAERIRRWLDPQDLIYEATGMRNGARLGVHSQQNLADLAGVDERRVRDVLAGTGNVSLRVADRICVALDIPIALVYAEYRS